jgi:sporulation protein YlmC with PRC-barrel domain
MKTTLAAALMGAVLISAPALAQNSADQGRNNTRQEAKAPPLYQMKAGEWRATKLDGLDVYNPNDEKIGDISDLILDRSGKIQAVVIGIGGFLGIGEHLVAVPFEQVQWVDQPRERRISGNDRTTPGSGTAGSGTSTSLGSTGMNSGADRQGGTATATAPADNTGATEAARTQTTTDPKTGATVTTTTGDNTVATGSDRPAMTGTDRSAATSSDHPAAMGTDRTANRDGNQNDTSRMYRPDHAIVAMTKDQLKALPEVRYSR